MESLFSKVIEINGKKLTKTYIESLSREEREELIEPLFEYLRKQGFIYPDDLDKVKGSYDKLLKYEPDLSKVELYNNSNIGTDICKYFCRSFYSAVGDINSRTMIELFNDDEVLRKLIRNRLGLSWNDGSMESFTLSAKMFIQGMRSMRLVNMTSMFKPEIAKYVYMKYSEPNDLCYDSSAGFGGRLLGCVSAGRRYIGVDPLTVPELKTMGDTLGLKNYKLVQCGSENYNLPDNIFDLFFTSPPYYNMEVYSKDDSQAYNRGADYFYNEYWAKTLENIKGMLKPGKYFILNVKEPRMLEMAGRMFEHKEQIALKTVRSHLNKSGKNDAIKHEFIYVFINNK